MLKVGWILKGDKNLGSSRIHGINIHNYLNESGWDSCIVRIVNPPDSIYNLKWKEINSILKKKYDILVFQQVAYGDTEFLNYLHIKQGGKSVFLICDLLNYPMFSKVNSIITSSSFLKNKISDKNKNTLVLSDALEINQDFFKRDYKQKNTKLKLVWLGNKENFGLLDSVREILKDNKYKNFELITISNHHNSTLKWSINNIDAVWKTIVNSDVAIIPSNDSDWQISKSNNKLATFMSLGLPVIAHPIPSYLEFARDKKTVVFAKTDAEWRDALTLLTNENERKNIGILARKKSVDLFSIACIGQQWKKALLDIYDQKNQIKFDFNIKQLLKRYLFIFYSLLK